ncbi:hypothetical protein, partial, partial [Parasitella parasitica]
HTPALWRHGNVCSIHKKGPAMASSAKEHNGTIKGTKSFQQTKKLWLTVISGGSSRNSSVMSASPTPQSNGEPEPLTSSDDGVPQVDHFSSKVARPFLKGTIPHSVLVDITNLSLTRLPAQYGRRDGGTAQLNDDMHHNLEKFGQLIDCGYVTGGSGIYAGGGYAVLAVNPTQREALEHSLNWEYHPIDYASGNLMDERDSVLALATWAAMPVYCKYCHSMHYGLLDVLGENIGALI